MVRAYLSGRTLYLLSGWVLFGTLAILFPRLMPPYLCLGAGIAAALASDLRFRSGLRNIDVEIAAPLQLELQKSALVECRLAGATLPGDVELKLRMPEQLGCRDAPVPVMSGKAQLEITAVRLGEGVVAEAKLLAASPLSLWLFERVVSATPRRISVVPSTAPMSEQAFQALRSRHLHLQQGLRLLSRNSSPDQYFSSRPYQYPDSRRFIDHRKSARFGSPYTKMFDSLHERHLVVALDVGRAGRGTIDGSAKHDYYRSAALWLLQHALRLGDSVSFVGFSDEEELVIPRARMLQAFAEVRSSPRLEAQDVASSFEVLLSLLQRVAPQRAVVIVLTDISLPSVQDQLLEFLPRVSEKHLCFCVGMLEDRLALDQRLASAPDMLGEDAYLRLLYSYWLEAASRNFSQAVVRFGSEAISVPQAHWLSTCARIYEQMRQSLAA